MAQNGKEAFLAEYQHEFDSKTGKVIPNYNEESQVITWSQFAKVFGERFIPRHWKAACGLDVGYSDGMHPHYSAWAFVAVAAENSPLPGAHFVYRGRSFIRTAIEDQAEIIKAELVPDVEIERGENGRVSVGIIKDWQMSHEATGTMLTLQRLNFPFRKQAHWGKESGIAQWNYLSKADHSQPNPFKEDEDLGGEWLIGRPSVYYIVEDDQLLVARDDAGLKVMREQIAGWDYVPTKINESGLTIEKPSKINDDFCDVLKNLFEFFGQRPTPLTVDERIQRTVDKTIGKVDPDDPDKAMQITRRVVAYNREKKRVEEGVVPTNPIAKMW